MIATIHTLVEPAGTMPLAAAESIREKIRENPVVLIAGGANLSVNQLKGVLA